MSRPLAFAIEEYKAGNYQRPNPPDGLHEIADGEVVLVKDTPKEAVEEETKETSEDLERAESVAVPEEETDSAEQEQL